MKLSSPRKTLLSYRIVSCLWTYIQLWLPALNAIKLFVMNECIVKSG